MFAQCLAGGTARRAETLKRRQAYGAPTSLEHGCAEYPENG